MIVESKTFNLVLILFILFSGCAVRADRIKLSEAKFKSATAKCFDAAQVSVGIAPVIDDRPELEKLGGKAKGLYLVVWNQKKGNYVTSDEDLGGNVSGEVGKLIQSGIEKTNCFRDLQLISTKLPKQPQPSDLLVVLAKERVKYVLVSQMKHLYGEQAQDGKFYLIPAYFVDVVGWGNHVAAAYGRAEFLFTLYDTELGYEVWRENIIADSESPEEGKFPEAAREALARSIEKLTKSLEQHAEKSLGAR